MIIKPIEHDSAELENLEWRSTMGIYMEEEQLFKLTEVVDTQIRSRYANNTQQFPESDQDLFLLLLVDIWITRQHTWPQKEGVEYYVCSVL